MRIFWWFDQPAWVCPQMMMALGLLVSMMFLMFAYRNLGKMVINPFDLLVCWIYPFPPAHKPIETEGFAGFARKNVYKKILVVTIATSVGQWTQLICFQRWASFTRHHWVLTQFWSKECPPELDREAIHLAVAWAKEIVLTCQTSIFSRKNQKGKTLGVFGCPCFFFALHPDGSEKSAKKTADR